MKIEHFFGVLLLGLAGCQPSSPGGVSADSTSAETMTGGDAITREKSIRVDKASRSTVISSASSLIFPVLTTDMKLPSGLDSLMSRAGTSAFVGSPADRVLMAMQVATRPVLAWPFDPMADEAKAKRWAAAVAGAVVVSNKAATAIAASLPANDALDPAALETRVRAAFERLSHADLSAELDQVAQEPVVLDLAETGSVRVLLSDGSSLVLDQGGATLARAGAVRFSYAGGILDGTSYQLAQDITQTAGLGKTRTQTTGTEISRGTSTGTTAGVK